MAYEDNEQELDWGKVEVIIDEGTDNAIVIADIVEGTTDLPTEQGEKTEARIEGGEVIASRRQRNKYSLTFQEYGQPSVENLDGYVPGVHSVSLYNVDGGEENKFLILKIDAKINVQPRYTSAQGTVTTYTCDAIRKKNGKSIEWGEIPTTETSQQ